MSDYIKEAMSDADFTELKKRRFSRTGETEVLCEKAWAEITRLRAQLAKAVEALRPFAIEAEEWVWDKDMSYAAAVIKEIENDHHTKS